MTKRKQDHLDWTLFKIFSKPSVCILVEPGKNCTKLVIKSATLSAMYGKLSCPNNTLQYEVCGREGCLEKLQEPVLSSSLSI